MLDSCWRIMLFGGLRLQRGSSHLEKFRTQKTAALLAYLACYAERRHTREALADLLWPEDDAETARTKLRIALASLRKQLEPPGVPTGAVLKADRFEIGLNNAAFTTDVAEFETLLQTAAHIASPENQAALLAKAAALAEGEFLVGQYEEWALTERERLAGLRLRALQRLVELLPRLGDLDAALDYAERAVAADPLHEESHLALIRLCLTAHQPQTALRHYRRLERTLREALDVEPSNSARALLLTLPAVGESRAKPLPTAVPRPPASMAATPASEPSFPAPENRLPPAFTRFFGREEEIERLQLLLETGQDSRLVTVTGPGGSGKTRVAVETARQSLSRYPGGVYFVPLADVRDSDQLLPALIEALRLPRKAELEPLSQIVQTFPVAPILLILDNFEQIGQGGDEIVQTLRERLPQVRLLVTSRQGLGLVGEQVFPLAALSTPLQPGTPVRLLEFPSVQLFLDRAQSVRPDFQITSRNADAIAGVCERLEGIPLALELAAAWVGTLTPTQMLSRLNRRLDLLISRRNDLSPRQRTLRGAIAWSYDLLIPELRPLFARLSLFRGGWTLEAAEALYGQLNAPQEARTAPARAPSEGGIGLLLQEARTTLEALEQLRERSLVLSEEQPTGEMRYRMLETLREFATEQLSPQEYADAMREHTRWYVALAREADDRHSRPEQIEWMDRLEAEHDNLRATLDRCFEENALSGHPDHSFYVEECLRMTAHLEQFWQQRSYFTEGRQRSLQALSHPLAQGWVRAAILSGMGLLAHRQGDYAAAGAAHSEALTIRRILGDPKEIAASLHNRAMVAAVTRDYAAAEQEYREALSILQKLGKRDMEAITLICLGNVFLYQRRPTEALHWFEQALTLDELQSNKSLLLSALNSIGTLHYDLEDPQSACRYFMQSLLLSQETGSLLDAAVALSNLANLAQLWGASARCVRCYTVCETLRERIGSPWKASARQIVDEDLTQARAALGEEAFQQARLAGREMTLPQIIEDLHNLCPVH